MSQHFQGPFGSLVLTFCGPGPCQILIAIGMRDRLISTLTLGFGAPNSGIGRGKK